MAHQITDKDSAMFVKEPAWHGLGVVLESAPETSEEAIKAAGLDWIVEKRKMYLGNGSEIPDAFAMVRNTDENVLGVTGNRYTVLQNQEAFQFFDPLIETEIAKYETAGSLFGGKRVWILAKLNGEIELTKNDVVQKYVLLSNTHNGTGGVVCKISPVRVVCNNTLTAALNQKAKQGDEIKIRHTSAAADRVKEASKLLSTINETYDNLAKVWKGMMQVNMLPVATMDYFKEVYPDSETAKNTKRTQTKRAEVMQLMSNSSLGGTLEGTEGTLWGAYNAATAAADHFHSIRKGSSKEKHLDSVWFGNKYEEKDRALQVALEVMRKEGVSLDL